MRTEQIEALPASSEEYSVGDLFDTARSLCPAVLFWGGGGKHEKREHKKGDKVKVLTRGMFMFSPDVPTPSELRNPRLFHRIHQLDGLNRRRNKRKLIEKIRLAIPGPIYSYHGYYIQRSPDLGHALKIMKNRLRENRLVFSGEKKR